MPHNILIESNGGHGNHHVGSAGTSTLEARLEAAFVEPSQPNMVIIEEPIEEEQSEGIAEESKDDSD